MKTKVVISFAVTFLRFCVIVFAYVKKQFSRDAAQLHGCVIVMTP